MKIKRKLEKNANSVYNNVDKKIVYNYYEKEALFEHRQKAMYDKDKWDSYWHVVLQQKVITTLKKLSPIKNFIDVGCAEGLYDRCYERIDPDANVIGIDIAKNYLVKAKIESPKTSFVQADMEYIPFKNRKFDIVLCTETLEHVLNPKKSFLELLRLSNKYVILSIPGHTPLFYLIKFLGLIKDKDPFQIFSSPGKGHINDISIDLIEEWLNEYREDFVIIERYTYCYFPPDIAKKFRIPIFFLIIFDRIISKIPIINKVGLVQYAVIKNKKYKYKRRIFDFIHIFNSIDT